MTFIRMTDGRDRGRVLELPFEDAAAMLASGQALPVDLSVPGAMDFQELPETAVLGDVLVEALPQPAEPLSGAAEASSVAQTRRAGIKPAGSFRRGR